jgi:hypothetical protein
VVTWSPLPVSTRGDGDVNYQTCTTCGATLLWLNGRLGCARRHTSELLAANSSPRHDGAKPTAAAGDGAGGGRSVHAMNPPNARSPTT